MQLFLAVVIVVGVVAYGHDDYPECGRERQETAHKFHEHHMMQCRYSNFTDNFKKGMSDSMCMYPKETVVPLVSDDPDLKYLPGAVVVKRCSGMCHKQLSCIPTEIKMTEFSVRRRREGEGKSSCGVVHVEEHVRCKCDCTVMEEDCNPVNQEYSRPECMCRCLNMKDKEDCELNDKLWNQQQCKCYCKKKEICTTGLYWVPDLCQCVKMTGNEIVY